MRITLKCPVNARVRTRGGDHLRAFGMERAEFDIRDAPAGLLPPAIVFRSGRGGEAKLVYRHDPDTGQMYRSVGAVSKVEADAIPELPDKTDPSGYRALMEKDDALLARLQARKLPVFPRNSSDRARWSSIRERFERVNEADIEARFAEAQAILDRYVVVEKKIWQPCPEPVFMVARGTRAWSTYLVDRYPSSVPSHTHYFAADEFDRAVAWMDILDAEVGVRT